MQHAAQHPLSTLQDLFEKKIKETDLKVCFPTYKGAQHSVGGTHGHACVTHMDMDMAMHASHIDMAAVHEACSPPVRILPGFRHRRLRRR